MILNIKKYIFCNYLYTDKNCSLIVNILNQGLITKIIRYSYIFGILFYFIWRYINYYKDNVK
jgi:hypothetical protein